MMRTSSAIALGLGLVLSGCGSTDGSGTAAAGSSESSSASPTNSSSSAPADREPSCADVWATGQSLPESYDGCSQDGAWVAAQAQRCESGQVLVTFGDRFYAAKGAQVNDVGEPLSASTQYRRATKSCG